MSFHLIWFSSVVVAIALVLQGCMVGRDQELRERLRKDLWPVLVELEAFVSNDSEVVVGGEEKLWARLLNGSHGDTLQQFADLADRDHNLALEAVFENARPSVVGDIIASLQVLLPAAAVQEAELILGDTGVREIIPLLREGALDPTNALENFVDSTAPIFAQRLLSGRSTLSTLGLALALSSRLPMGGGLMAVLKVAKAIGVLMLTAVIAVVLGVCFQCKRCLRVPEKVEKVGDKAVKAKVKTAEDQWTTLASIREQHGATLATNSPDLLSTAGVEKEKGNRCMKEAITEKGLEQSENYKAATKAWQTAEVYFSHVIDNHLVVGSPDGLEKAKEELHNVHTNLANVYHKRFNHEFAIEFADKALKHRANCKASYWKVSALIELKRWKEARECIPALEAEPASAEKFNNIINREETKEQRKFSRKSSINQDRTCVSQ